MKFLIVGDIVGRPGVERLKKEIPYYVQQEAVDFCIVNGENSANGKGMRMQEYEQMMGAGADVITLGNHIYYRKEMATEYIKLPRLLLPANVTNLDKNGSMIVEKNGVKIGVIDLIGNVFMGEMLEKNTTDPFAAALQQVNHLKEQGADYIFVDFHAEVTAEKVAMGHFLAGKVTCVFGTHTHVQTSDETIMEGTAYITDLGMTGPKNSVLGLKKEIAIERFTTGNFIRYECSNNAAQFNAMIVETEDATHQVVAVHRIQKA